MSNPRARVKPISVKERLVESRRKMDNAIAKARDAIAVAALLREAACQLESRHSLLFGKYINLLEKYEPEKAEVESRNYAAENGEHSWRE